MEHDEHNHAKQSLDEDSITIHENCDMLVGLGMAATDPGGGHVYLSSADRIGYQQLLIQQSCMPGGIGATEDVQVIYNTYDMRVARENFDSISGEIRPCSGYGRCEAYLKNWYLCSVSS